MEKIHCDICGKEIKDKNFTELHYIKSTEEYSTNSDWLEICFDCETAIKGFIKLRKQMLEYDRKQKERSYGRNEK